MLSTVQLLLILVIGINGTRIEIWIYKQLIAGIVVISEKNALQFVSRVEKCRDVATTFI